MVKYHKKKDGQLVKVEEQPIQQPQQEYAYVQKLTLPPKRISSRKSEAQLKKSQSGLLPQLKSEQITQRSNKLQEEQLESNKKIMATNHSQENLQTQNTNPNTMAVTHTTPSEISSKYQFVDDIPFDDPIWKELIPPEIYNNPKIDLKRLVDDNYEYFHHQLGMCACFRCDCGLCHCNFIKNVKMNFNLSFLSVYAHDFLEKNQNFNLLSPLNQTNYNTKFDEQKTIDFNTQQRVSYKPFDVKPSERYKANQDHFKTKDIYGTSSYQASFANWGALKMEYFKRPEHVSTFSQMPFLGQTLYQQSFGDNKNVRPATQQKHTSSLQQIPHLIEKNDVANGINAFQRKLQPENLLIIQNQTNNQSQGRGNIKQLKIIQTIQLENAPRYDGQYQTLMNQDFKGKQKRICPAQQFKHAMHKRLIQKMKKGE